MGCRFDRGGLALLFADAPPRSSVPGKTKVSCCGRGKEGAASHFSKVRSGAIQRTFAEGEGRSQDTDYMEQIHQQWVVLCMDNWYNKQFTANPDKND